jgi:acyl dehydratase
VSDEPQKVITQRGLWFEEFEPGVRYLHRPGRTITEADNVLFTTLTMNTQALHLDAAFAEELPPFHQRLVNSMFTLSTLVGLSVAQLTQGIVTFAHTARNQHGDVVATATRKTLVRKRPADEAGRAHPDDTVRKRPAAEEAG